MKYFVQCSVICVFTGNVFTLEDLEIIERNESEANLL